MARRGDWICPSCSDRQFARNARCRSCGTEKPAGATASSAGGAGGSGRRGGGGPRRLEGDWDCPKCGDHQFARNTACRKCGTARPAGAGPRGDAAASSTAPAGDGSAAGGAPVGVAPTGDGEGSGPAWDASASGTAQPQQGGGRSRGRGQGGGKRGRHAPRALLPGDWRCPGCGDHQFARNPKCRLCGAARPPESEREGGVGAGTVRGAEGIPVERNGGRGRGSGGAGEEGAEEPKRATDGGKPASDKKSRPMLEGDWRCPKCGDHQFARNTRCRLCDTPKPAAAGTTGDAQQGGRTGGSGAQRGGGSAAATSRAASTTARPPASKAATGVASTSARGAWASAGGGSGLTLAERMKAEQAAKAAKAAQSGAPALPSPGGSNAGRREAQAGHRGRAANAPGSGGVGADTGPSEADPPVTASTTSPVAGPVEPRRTGLPPGIDSYGRDDSAAGSVPDTVSSDAPAPTDEVVVGGSSGGGAVGGGGGVEAPAGVAFDAAGGLPGGAAAAAVSARTEVLLKLMHADGSPGLVLEARLGDMSDVRGTAAIVCEYEPGAPVPADSALGSLCGAYKAETGSPLEPYLEAAKFDGDAGVRLARVEVESPLFGSLWLLALPPSADYDHAGLVHAYDLVKVRLGDILRGTGAMSATGLLMPLLGVRKESYVSPEACVCELASLAVFANNAIPDMRHMAVFMSNEIRTWLKNELNQGRWNVSFMDPLPHSNTRTLAQYLWQLIHQRPMSDGVLATCRDVCIAFNHFIEAPMSPATMNHFACLVCEAGYRVVREVVSIVAPGADVTVGLITKLVTSSRGLPDSVQGPCYSLMRGGFKVYSPDIKGRITLSDANVVLYSVLRLLQDFAPLPQVPMMSYPGAAYAGYGGYAAASGAGAAGGMGATQYAATHGVTPVGTVPMHADWTCVHCGTHQYARDTMCQVCGAPRPGTGSYDDSGAAPAGGAEPGYGAS